MSAPIAVSEIEAKLVDRAPELCQELLPNGYRDGPRWRVGNINNDRPSHAHGGSLIIWVDGPKAGAWLDMNPSGPGRDRGDLLWLVACVHFGGELGKAVAWAKSWLHLDELDPGRLEQFKLEATAQRERRQVEAAEQTRRNRASARRRWLMGIPIGGTIVESYLAGRGIDLRRLGRAPGALRFGAHTQFGTGDEAVTLPAMLAVICNLAGDHIGTHRTALKRDGSGKAGSDEGLLGAPKQVLGAVSGGHIPIWKGAAGSMPLRDVPPGTDVWISEGIEDGLTAACADPSLRIIAGVSLGNFARLELPPQVHRIIFIKQNDAPGGAADQAYRKAVKTHRLAGRRVLQVVPPPHVKDINELAQLALAEAAA